MNEEEALKELAKEKLIESEASQMSQQIYFPENPKAELQKEKIKILKRLRQIDDIEGNSEIRKEALSREIGLRRLNYNKLMRDKRLSESSLNLYSNFNQAQKLNASGI